MKTIFITSFNPFISRNILETDVLRLLKQQMDWRIVIFVPDYKKDYFVKNFGSRNVLIEGVKELSVAKQDIVFKYLAGSLIDTKTRWFHQRRKLSNDKNYFHYWFSCVLAKVFSKISLVIGLIRFFDFLFIEKDCFARYFSKYNPDLLFATDIFHNNDVHFLAEAKKHDVLTVGMVRSWDNITNKGLFRFKPDKLIVHNDIIKRETIKYENMKAKDIFISGMPQLDYYFKESRLPKGEFFARIGFDPSCRLIFFSPLGKRFIDTDGQVLEILKEALAQKLMPDDIRFLVRLPPNDDVVFNNFSPDSNFFIYKTGIPFKTDIFSDWEVTKNEWLTLADSLYYSSLVVVYASSLIIDAAAFDKPIVLISFDGFKVKDKLNSVNRFVNYYDHTKNMLKTHCCTVARSKEELIEGINMYLRDTKLYQPGRARLFREQVYKFDGQSAARIAGFIISQVNTLS